MTDLTATAAGPAAGARPTPEAALRAVAASLGEGVEVRALSGRPRVAVVGVGDDLIKLRVAPPWVDKRQLERVHRLLSEPAMAGTGTAPVPHQPRSIREQDGYLVEATSWAEGRDWTNGRVALVNGWSMHRPLPAPAGGLSALTRALATAHVASEGTAQRALASFPLREFDREQRDLWARLRGRILASRAREVHIGRWLKASEQVAAASFRLLNEASFLESVPPVALHRQLWPAHVVADRDRLTLIDWSRAVSGAALIDIAQVVTRFNGWDTAVVEEVLDTYADVRQLTGNERRLLPIVACLDLIVETGRLLEVAHANPDIAPESDAAESARSGAAAGLHSLERLFWAVRGETKDRPRPGRGPRTPTSPRGSATPAAPRRRGARRPKQ